MFKEGTFRELVEFALEQHPELVGMEVIVEKELLHYELLHVLNRGGWLDGLTFQGGTALRLCYGASRLSEDLDFSGGPGFSTKSMDGLATYLKKTLSGRSLGVDVKSPKTITSHFNFRHWSEYLAHCFRNFSIPARNSEAKNQTRYRQCSNLYRRSRCYCPEL